MTVIGRAVQARSLAARKAKERRATALEPALCEAFAANAPAGLMSNAMAARWLAEFVEPSPASVRLYLNVYRKRGDAGSRFHRLYAARAGSAAREFEAETGYPAAWRNPATGELPAPAKVELPDIEPALPKLDGPAFYPDGFAPSPEMDMERWKPVPVVRAYDPMAWRYS